MNEQLNIEDLFFKLPLYKKVKLKATDIQLILDLFHYQHSVEGFNPSINQNSTFEVVRKSYRQKESTKFYDYVGINQIDLNCVRNNFHINFFFLIEQIELEDDVEYILTKIGQNPSIADLEFSKFNKYNKVIDKDSIREIKKAIGLAANGIGIGSFVYLRRVFEDLIENRHQELVKLENWDEEKYRSAKMDDKILMLKSSLPEVLVINRKVYGIVSKGIHELTEQECLQYFNVLLDAITIMLEKDFLKRQEELRISDMMKNLEKINQDIKK